MTESDPRPDAPTGARAVDVLALDPPPYRVVDGTDWGWHATTPTADGVTLYHRDLQSVIGRRRGDRPEPRTLAALAEGGPLRPVTPISTGDRERLVRVLVAAERRALVSALLGLRAAAYAHTMAREPAPHGTYGHALLGGRGGSNEAAGLVDAVGWIGETHVGSSRIDKDVFETVELLVGRWIGNPRIYVEVAANMAYVFGEAADLAEGRQGPATIADAWACRAGAMPPSILRWALATSERHPYAG